MSEFEGVTFQELQDSIIKRGGKDANMMLRMQKQYDERQKEKCDLCGKFIGEHDSREFIYLHNINKKVGWECVEMFVLQNCQR